MSVLQGLADQRRQAAETERQRLLGALETELKRLLPAGSTVWIFGSAAHPGRFNEHSDLDLALDPRPVGVSEYRLQAELSERLERRVDVLVLEETRLKEKIVREGVKWTL